LGELKNYWAIPKTSISGIAPSAIIYYDLQMNPIVAAEAMGILTRAGTLAALANDVTDSDFLAEFLQLKTSPATRRTYAQCLDDFFLRLAQVNASIEIVREFLSLNQHQAIALVLKYQSLLVEANLAPATINTRISAVKSLVNHARRLGKCEFALSDIKSVAAEVYRDTSGVDPDGIRAILATCDRSTTKGVRDYALIRLLWDNALRRGEVSAANVGDFDAKGRKLWIKGKGKIHKVAIDLHPVTVAAVRDWLGTRGDLARTAPLFISLDDNSSARLQGRGIYQTISNRSKQAGITKQMSPHRVRHSAITAYLDASGGDVRSAQGLSRHKNLNTLTRYDDNRHQYQGKATDVLADLV
jgi:integrase/recombinase XerC